MKYLDYIKKIWGSIEKHHKTKISYFFLFNLFTAFLEILSIGLVLPVLHLILGNDVSENNFGLSQDVFSQLKNILNTENLIEVFLIVLVLVFILKNLVIAYFIWWQKDFVKKIHVSVAQRLFSLYLNKEYTFHLKTNSSILFRNITTEVGNFTNSLANVMLLITEAIIFTLIFCLLIYVNPVSTLIVLLIFGIPSLLFLFIVNLLLL